MLQSFSASREGSIWLVNESVSLSGEQPCGGCGENSAQESDWPASQAHQRDNRSMPEGKTTTGVLTYK